MEVAARAASDDLLEAIDRGFSEIAAASAEILRAVAEYDRRKLWRRDGATSMTSWLAARYVLAWGTAREWVRVARAVRKLPAIADSYRSGGLSWDQLRPPDPVRHPRVRRVLGPEGPGSLGGLAVAGGGRHQRATVREAEDTHRRRYLAIWRDPDRPVVYLDGALGAEQGAALEAALARHAEQVVLADDPDDPAGARMADALVELATASGGEPAPPILVIHAEAAVVAGKDRVEVPGWPRPSGGTACRPTPCAAWPATPGWSGSWRRGAARWGWGGRGRVVRGQVARVLRHRDGGACRFPGCRRRKWLNAHHLVHWADGGPTDLDNLVLLCGAHHRLIHEGGWRISGHPGRDLRFHDPGGGRSASCPEPVRSEPPRADLAQPPRRRRSGKERGPAGAGPLS